MRHRVTVQKQSTVRDALGQKTDTWSNVAVRWAFVEPLRGVETFERSGETTQVDYKITMRHEAGLLSTDRRIVYGTQTFDIEAVINIHEKDHTMEVMCRGSNRN